MSRHAVVEIVWTENGVPRQETFGLWTVKNEDSHWAELEGFLQAWRETTSQSPQRVTCSLVQDPAEWLAAEKERRAEAGR